MPNRWKDSFSLLIVLAGLAVIGWLLFHGWHEVRSVLPEVSWTLFVGSLALAIAGTAVLGSVFQALLRKYGLRVSALRSLELLFYGQVTKYVPGKLWPILYQASVVGGSTGSAIKGTVAANLDMMLIAFFSSATLGAALLVASESPVLSLLVIVAGYWLAMLSITGCFVSDAIRMIITTTGLRWDRLTTTCSRAEADFSLMASCAAWFLVPIAAYFLMLTAVFHLSSSEMMVVTAHLLLAWIVGTLTVVVPAGLGVREMIFVGLGTIWSDGLPEEKLMAIAVISRLWQVLQDVSGGTLLFLFAFARRRLIN